MRVRVALVVSLALALAPGVRPAAARPMVVDVRTAEGRSLGRLTGQAEGSVVYFALADIARLAGATVRRIGRHDRVGLSLHGQTVELRRDQAVVRAGDRTWQLSAPVRVRRGAWLVPGDLLPQNLPALLGSGGPVGPGPAGPRPGVPGAPVAAAARTPPPAAQVSPLTLRHHSHADFTRIVVQGELPGEPVVAEQGTALLVSFPGAPDPGPRAVRSVRDGLVGQVEVDGERGAPAVRVTFERPPATRKVYRLADPPRVVLDFYRAPAPPVSGPAVAAPAAALAPRPAPETAPDSPAEDGAATEPPTRAGGLELRVRSYPTYTRVVLEGAAPLEPRLVEQAGGLVVALPGQRPVPGTARPVKDGLLAGLELTASRGAAALRVTFERPPAARRVHRFSDPPRVVLDFYRTDPRQPEIRRGDGGGLRTIVVDAGHGGHDPGAIGPAGLREKELTLDVAKRVAALLQEDAGVRVVLTRTKDQFLALRERTTLANREKADLFVSIHVNAAPARSAAGTETYFLSTEASDNAAREAAAFENKVISLETSARGGPRDVLRTILWDLAQSDFQQESSRLAEAVQNSLDRALRLPSRGVKQAPFYVLGGAAMPAVLVEIGFMSNPQEESRLRDDGYRDRIAQAIAQGIGGYKRHYEQRTGAVAAR